MECWPPMPVFQDHALTSDLCMYLNSCCRWAWLSAGTDHAGWLGFKLSVFRCGLEAHQLNDAATFALHRLIGITFIMPGETSGWLINTFPLDILRLNQNGSFNCTWLIKFEGRKFKCVLHPSDLGSSTSSKSPVIIDKAPFGEVPRLAPIYRAAVFFPRHVTWWSAAVGAAMLMIQWFTHEKWYITSVTTG